MTTRGDTSATQLDRLYAAVARDRDAFHETARLESVHKERDVGWIALQAPGNLATRQCFPLLELPEHVGQGVREVQLGKQRLDRLLSGLERGIKGIEQLPHHRSC